MAKPQNAAAKQDHRHPIDVHVGSRVKLRRMILGLSQESIGKSLGLTFQQIQKYEKGVNRIGASRMFEMAQLLNVPVQFFYDEMGGDALGGADGGSGGGATGFAESESGAALMELVNSPEGVQLCRYFSSIKDGEVKKRVLDLVKSIAENETGASRKPDRKASR